MTAGPGADPLLHISLRFRLEWEKVVYLKAVCLWEKDVFFVLDQTRWLLARWGDTLSCLPCMFFLLPWTTSSCNPALSTCPKHIRRPCPSSVYQYFKLHNYPWISSYMAIFLEVPENFHWLIILEMRKDLVWFTLSVFLKLYNPGFSIVMKHHSFIDF